MSGAAPEEPAAPAQAQEDPASPSADGGRRADGGDASGTEHAEQSTEQLFTLMSWNVAALAPLLPNMALKYKAKDGLRAFFEAHALDACTFQEVKVPDAKMTAEMACVPGWESFWAVSKEKQGYSGVTTWLRAPPWGPALNAWVDDLGAVTGAGEDLDREGRLVIVDVGPFVLASVYVPNAGDRPARARLEFKCRFLEGLKTRLCQFLHQGKEVVLVGDMNVALEPRDAHPARKWETLYAPEELKLLHSLTSTFVDVWRRLHPDTVDAYTVWEERTSARAFNVGTRIDFVLVSPGLLPHVESCEILLDMPRKWSDHAPLLLKLKGLKPHAGASPSAGPRAPCALSSRRMKRFARGPGIAAFFTNAAAAKRQKVASAEGGGEGSGSQPPAATPSSAAGPSSAPPPGQASEGAPPEDARAAASQDEPAQPSGGGGGGAQGERQPDPGGGVAGQRASIAEEGDAAAAPATGAARGPSPAAASSGGTPPPRAKGKPAGAGGSKAAAGKAVTAGRTRPITAFFTTKQSPKPPKSG